MSARTSRSSRTVSPFTRSVTECVIIATCLQPLSDPLPRLRLHLGIELVRRVIEAASLMIRHSRLAKALIDLLERGVYALRWKKLISRSVDDQHRAWRNQGGEIRQIQIAVESDDVEREAD